MIDPLETLRHRSRILAGAGIELVARRCTTDDEVVALAHDADAILVVIYPITDEVLAR